MKDERGIERKEIAGDAWDEVNADREREEAHREAPEQAPPTDAEMDDHHATWLRNAPPAALAAYIVAGDDPDEFDRIKAYLKGE